MTGSTALLVIDVQNNILVGAGPRQSAIDAAVDATVVRIAKLIDRARSASIPVIYVQHDGPAAHRLEAGQPGWEIRHEIAPMSGEPVIHKTTSDAFFQTSLEQFLIVSGISRLIVAGCMTQYCVDTTVRRAVSLGYDVVLAADGHMTRDGGGLTFEQIIEHHNELLDGFDAGSHEVQVVPIAHIAL